MFNNDKYIHIDENFIDSIVDNNAVSCIINDPTDDWVFYDPVYVRALTLKNGFLDIQLDMHNGLWNYSIEYASRWEWDTIKESRYVFGSIDEAYRHAVADYNADIKRMTTAISRCDRVYQKHHFWEMIIGLPDQQTPMEE